MNSVQNMRRVLDLTHKTISSMIHIQVHGIRWNGIYDMNFHSSVQFSASLDDFWFGGKEQTKSKTLTDANSRLVSD